VNPVVWDSFEILGKEEMVFAFTEDFDASLKFSSHDGVGF